MKTVFIVLIGFCAGLYFSDYRAVRVLKRETHALVNVVDGAIK